MRLASELAKEIDCWTADEFAAFTGCTPLTLEAWRKRGKGPDFVRAGNAVLYPRSEVQAWLKQQHGMRARRAAAAKDML